VSLRARIAGVAAPSEGLADLRVLAGTCTSWRSCGIDSSGNPSLRWRRGRRTSGSNLETYPRVCDCLLFISQLHSLFYILYAITVFILTSSSGRTTGCISELPPCGAHPIHEGFYLQPPSRGNSIIETYDWMHLGTTSIWGTPHPGGFIGSLWVGKIPSRGVWLEGCSAKCKAL